MSRVTNLLLHFGTVEDEREMLTRVNLFFTNQFGFIDIETPQNGWYGGSKHLEVNLAVGAFNYLDLKALVRHIKKLEWRDKEAVQLIVCDHDDLRFRIINIFSDAEE
jgi:hypothetical protein